MCDNFTRTDTCRQHQCFLSDCRRFGSDVPIFVVSTVVSGLMVVTIIVVCDRGVVIDEYSLVVLYGDRLE